MQKLLRWFAFLWALLVIGALLVIPMGEYQRETVDASGAVTRTSGRTSFVEGQGASAFVALSIPLLFSLAVLLPWPARGRRGVYVASAAIVTVFCLLASFSIGPFFYPTALALIIVAAWPRSRGPAT